MKLARRRWTVASVTALLGAVAACGSFSADDPAPPIPPSDAGVDVGSDAGTTDVDAPACNGNTNLATSPDHCGRCDHSCLGGACVASTCETMTIAKGIEKPRYLRQFGAHLFLVSANALLRVSKTEDRGTVTLRSPVDLSAGLAVDKDHVFAAGAAGLRMYTHDGRAEVIINASETTEVAVAGEKVFTCLLGPKTDLLEFPRAPADAGTVIVKETENCRSIAPAGAALFFGGDQLHRAELGVVKKAAELKPSDPAADRIAIDDSWVFSIAKASAAVARRPRGDGSKDVAFVNGTVPVVEGDIALDATHVYWTTGGAAGGVYRAPKVGGSAEPIAVNEAFPLGVAVDDDAVYWTNHLSGEVRKRAKPPKP